MKNSNLEAIKMNALALALFVPQTVQAFTGQRVQCYGLCAKAKLELLETVARQCSSEPATVTRTNTSSKVWDTFQGAGCKSYAVARTAAACTAEACSNVGATYSNTKEYVACSGADGINSIVGSGAAAVGAIGNGVVAVGKGVVSLPSMVLVAPRVVCDQVKHDAQLTKEYVVAAKNWLTGRKVDQVQASKLAFDLHVADATGEMSVDDCSENGSTTSDYTLESRIAAAAE